MLVLPLKLKPIVSLQEFRYLVKGFCYSSFALVWIFSGGNQKLATILSEAGKRQRQHKQCDRRVVKATRLRVAFLLQIKAVVLITPPGLLKIRKIISKFNVFYSIN